MSSTLFVFSPLFFFDNSLGHLAKCTMCQNKKNKIAYKYIYYHISFLLHNLISLDIIILQDLTSSYQLKSYMLIKAIINFSLGLIEIAQFAKLTFDTFVVSNTLPELSFACNIRGIQYMFFLRSYSTRHNFRFTLILISTTESNRPILFD